MKTIKTISALFLCAFFISNIELVSAQSNDTIWIPLASEPLIDGIVSSGEWSDASTTSITEGDFLYKHNNSHLYVAFTNTSYQGSTGVYIDKNHDGGSSPQSDDI